MSKIAYGPALGKVEEERLAAPAVEAALLGDLLLSPVEVDRALALGVTGETFTDARHRAVFLAILEVRAAGVTPDLVAVARRLRETGHSFDTLVAGLPNATPVAALAEDHARLLLGLQRRREAHLAAQEVAHLLVRPGVAPEVLVRAGALYDAVEALASSQARPAGPEVLSLADLLKTPEPQYLYAAAPLVPHPGVTLLAGPGGAFKSWIVSVLALDLAEGRPFLGRFGVARPLRVLLVDLEMGRDRLARRFRLLGADPACERLCFVTEPLDLYDATHRQWALRREDDVIIIDPVVRAFRGDENLAGDVDRFYREAVFPFRRAGKSVILVHHLRKFIGGQSSSDLDALIRGSGDWKNGVDSAFVLIREDERRVVVHQTKARDDLEVSPFVVRLDVEGGRASLVYEGDAERALPGLRPVRESLLEVLGEEMCGADEVLGALRGRYAEHVVRATLRALESEGVIERVRVGKRIFYSVNGREHHRE